MRESLALTTILYAAGLTVWLVVQAYRPSAKPVVSLAALGVLELALALLAAMDVLSLFQGRRPPDMAVHLAYLGASVALLPMVAGIGMAGRKEPGLLVPAVGCAAVVIVVIRIQTTGGA
jgi:hypothetical protein